MPSEQPNATGKVEKEYKKGTVQKGDTKRGQIYFSAG
jgi:hypothetical protein